MKKLLMTLCILSLSTLSFAKVNINTATVKELSALKGIGGSKAALIVHYRKNHGEFKKIDDLVHVKGIGKSTLAKIKNDLSLEGKTDLSDVKSAHTKATKKRRVKKSMHERNMHKKKEATVKKESIVKKELQQNVLDK